MAPKPLRWLSTHTKAVPVGRGHLWGEGRDKMGKLDLLLT